MKQESDECDDIKVLIGKSLYASGNQVWIISHFVRE